MKPNWTAAVMLTPAAILTAVALAYGSVAPHGGDADKARPSIQQDQSPSERFADAPHGIDPIVTGPAPKALRERQKALDCDTARWPDNPAGCYPDMKTMN